MSGMIDDSSNPETSQTTKQRQEKLDTIQAQIDAPLQKALTEFVETHISPGVTITPSWCLWQCAWQTDTGNLNVFLECEGPEDTCFLLVSYLPSLSSFHTFEATVGYLNPQVLSELCQHLQAHTGLPTRLG